MRYDTIISALASDDSNAEKAACYAAESMTAGPELIKEWLSSDIESFRVAATHVAVYNMAPEELLIDMVEHVNYDLPIWRVMEPMSKALCNHYISVGGLEKLVCSDSDCERILGTMALRRRDAPLWMALYALDDDNQMVRSAAVPACDRHDIPAPLIDRWRKSQDDFKRMAAMYALRWHADLPFSWVAEGLHDSSQRVQMAASLVCCDRHIPNRWLKHWVGCNCGSPDCTRRCLWNPRISHAHFNDMTEAQQMAVIYDFVRRDRMNRNWRKTQGAHKRMRVIYMMAFTSSKIVRQEAARALIVDKIALNRDVEPKDMVYWPCLGGVIVVAKIPKDAHIIRGGHGNFRASKAVIHDIIGDFYGEKVAIPASDLTRQWYIGDSIDISNFDMSIAPIGTSGFYFYLTEEEAREARGVQERESWEFRMNRKIWKP